MSIQNQSDCQNTLGTVEDIIRAIEKKTTDGDYIFRGESQCYEKVSSNLYRELEVVKMKYSDIADVQAEIAEEAKVYLDETDEFEILSALQHYGGKTNLIDFTTNYNVALFFACYGHPDKPGRVIVLQKTEVVKRMLKSSPDSVKRAVDQESVFIQPHQGFITPDDDDIITIPKDLKLFILEHLREHPDREISPKTIYNDIHGFIRTQTTYWMCYREFYDGLTWKDKGDEVKDLEEKQKVYKKAVDHYTKALEHDLQQTAIYNNRGNAYVAISEINKGIEDFSKAIELYPSYANAYVNRGEAYLREGKFDKAIDDYNIAIGIQPGFAEAYNNRGKAYNENGEVDKALIDFNKAIKLDSTLAEAYNNRGNVYESKNKFEKALIDFNTAIQLRTDFVDAYINRGVAYGKRDKFDEAIKDLADAINIDEYHAGAYFNLGNVYLLNDNFNKAVENYDISLKLDPDAISYCHRGLTFLNLKKWNNARDDLTIAKNKGFDVVSAFHNLYRDVAAFEQKYDVKMPKDIVALLTQYSLNRYFTTQKSVFSKDGLHESSEVLKLLKKFQNMEKTLSEYLQKNPSRGITTGCNKAFIVKRPTHDALIADHPSSADLLKPYMMVSEINRWCVKRQNKWLIFTQHGIDIDSYPAIKKHLQNYFDVLRKRSGKQEWYELQIVSKETNWLEQPKCFYPETASETTFAFDDEGYYIGSPGYLLPTKQLWLLGVLNTKAVTWLYAHTTPQTDRQYLKFTPRYVAEIPIPNMPPEQKTLIQKLVEYILYIKKQLITKTETQINNNNDYIMLAYFGNILDALVYELYLPNELHKGKKHFFQPLLNEKLPSIDEIQGDRINTFREIFEYLYHKDHPVRRNYFFLDSIKEIRIIESKI